MICSASQTVGRRVIEVVDPTHGVVEILGLGGRGWEDDERFAIEALGKAEEFVGTEAGVV
jgi:hypothetical protein